MAAYARRHLAPIASEDLSTERRLVAEKIIHLSFDASRSVARLPDQRRLCIITGLHKSDVSRAGKDLTRARMLERWQEHGETFYRFLPHAAGWAVRWRHPDARTRQLAIDTEAWLFGLNAAAPPPKSRTFPCPRSRRAWTMRWPRSRARAPWPTSSVADTFAKEYLL